MNNPMRVRCQFCTNAYDIDYEEYRLRDPRRIICGRCTYMSFSLSPSVMDWLLIVLEARISGAISDHVDRKHD